MTRLNVNPAKGYGLIESLNPNYPGHFSFKSKDVVDVGGRQHLLYSEIGRDQKIFVRFYPTGEFKNFGYERVRGGSQVIFLPSLEDSCDNLLAQLND